MKGACFMVAHHCQSKKKKKKKNLKIKKNIIQKKTPQNYHGPLVPNLMKRFYSKRKKNTKSPWLRSARSDT